MNHKKILFFIPLLFLSSCLSMITTAPSSVELEDMLKRNLVLLPDNSFEKLPSSLIDNEIIFLGEIHGIGELRLAEYRLAVYLAAQKPVVLAWESCYGLGPFLEAASLGTPKAARPVGVPKCIKEFNAEQSAEGKIMLTAIDIEHSIFHHKKDTTLFLHDISSRSTSETARQTIDAKIVRLAEQDTYDKMNSYLKELKQTFQKHIKTFSSEDQDEILFSMELLKASNYYQYVNRGLKIGWQDSQEVRYKYFNKTIERAYAKAKKRNAILVCRVGSWHIVSSYRSEARYFARDYSPTKGKVASIRLVPLYYGSEAGETASKDVDGIDAAAETMMGPGEYSYLSLAELKDSTGHSFAWSKHYNTNSPNYDGILFVGIEKTAGGTIGKK